MKARAHLAVTAAAILVLLGVATAGAEPDETVPGRAGQRVHVDPETGRVVPPAAERAPVPVPLPDEAAFATSSEGLVPVPGRSRAGGVAVDLQGRFRSTVRAERRPDGTIVTDCVPGATVEPGR